MGTDLHFMAADMMAEENSRLTNQIRKLCRKAVNAEANGYEVLMDLIDDLGKLTGDDFWGEEVSA